MFKSKYEAPTNTNIDMFVFDSSKSPNDTELNNGSYKVVNELKDDKKYSFKISTKSNTDDCKIIISASNAKKLRQYLELIKSYGTLKNNLFIDIFKENLDKIIDFLRDLISVNTNQIDKYHMYFISLYHKMYWIITIIQKITGIDDNIKDKINTNFNIIETLYTAKPLVTNKLLQNTPFYPPIVIFKNVLECIAELYKFITMPEKKEVIQFNSDIIILSIIESENIEVLYTGNLIGDIIMINLANNNLVFTTNIIIGNNDYMKKLIDNNKKKDKEYISELVKESKVINDKETKKINDTTSAAEYKLKNDKGIDKKTKIKELKEKAKETLINNIKREIDKMTNTLQVAKAYIYEDFKAYYIKETQKENFCIKPDSNYKLIKDGGIKTMLQARHMPVVIHTSSEHRYAINTGTMIDSYDKKLPKECRISIYCSDLIQLKTYLQELLKDSNAKIKQNIPITIIKPNKVEGFIIGADINDTYQFIKFTKKIATQPDKQTFTPLPLHKFSTLCIKKDQRENHTDTDIMARCYTNLIDQTVSQVPESTKPDVSQVSESTIPDVKNPEPNEAVVIKPAQTKASKPLHTLETLKKKLEDDTIKSEAAKLAAEKEEKAKQEKAAVIAAKNYKTQQEAAKQKSDAKQNILDNEEKEQKKARIQEARAFNFSNPSVVGSTQPASDNTTPKPSDATARNQQAINSALAGLGGGKKTHRR